MSTNELTAKVRELKELKTMAEEINAEISAIEDTIKTEMLETGVEEMNAGIYKVRYPKVKSNRFDSAAFKAAMPELYEHFIRQTETRRFTVV